MGEFLLGLGIGLGAGLTPGPLLALVVSNTLKRGFGAGIRVALAPIVTDAPIVAATLLVVESVPPAALRALAAGGAIYLLWLAAETLRTSPAIAASDFRQGITANFLSPHPWLFWLGAGAPIVRTAWERAPGRAVAFVVGFYVLLIGTKIGVAGLVAFAKQRMVERWYRAAVTASAALLVVAAASLVWQVVLPE